MTDDGRRTTSKVGHTPQDLVNRASIKVGRGGANGGAQTHEQSFIKEPTDLEEGEFAPVDGGEVWRIDTGASSGIASGAIEALEVRAGGVVSVLRQSAPLSADSREALPPRR
mmetsp:Transcript_29870/g.79819  ORF Transcript_29870/g.79819 Transcript_29870/m.79819 type:complete len:112 (-) Transcript_29870:519-854(-)